MLTISARFRIKEGKEEEALAQLKSMAGDVQANEEGALAYACHRNLDDPLEVIFFEVYRDKDALTAHRGTDHMKQMNSVFKDLFEGPVKIEKLERIGGFVGAC